VDLENPASELSPSEILSALPIAKNWPMVYAEEEEEESLLMAQERKAERQVMWNQVGLSATSCAWLQVYDRDPVFRYTSFFLSFPAALPSICPCKP
jgi:hypothetical protein